MEQSDAGTAVLTCEVSQRDGYEVVELVGEVDLATLPDLEATLGGLTGRQLIIDLCRVTFMDSTALHALLDHQARMGEGYTMKVLCGPNSMAARLFSLAGVDGAFDFGECPPEAGH